MNLYFLHSVTFSWWSIWLFDTYISHRFHVTYRSQIVKTPRPVTSLHSGSVNVLKAIRYRTLPLDVSCLFRVAWQWTRGIVLLSSVLDFLQTPVCRNIWGNVYIKSAKGQTHGTIAYMWHWKYSFLCFRKGVGHLFVLGHNLWQIGVQISLACFNP